MKCPKCGKELLIRDEKVSVNESGEAVFNQFAICTDCKKKWNLDKQRAKAAAKKSQEKEAAPQPATSIKEAAAKREAIARHEASSRPETPVRREPSSRREAPARKLSSDTAVRGERPASRNPQAKNPQTRRPQARPEEELRARHAKPKASQQTYSNIPPKDVRKTREDEMRKGYDELLSIEDEPTGSKAPVIILIILIIATLGAAGTIFYCKLTDRPVPFISQAEPNQTVITASIEAEETAELPAELQNVEF